MEKHFHAIAAIAARAIGEAPAVAADALEAAAATRLAVNVKTSCRVLCRSSSLAAVSV